eukprot:1159692-Pelagomonas_calceolata.AAC.2
MGPAQAAAPALAEWTLRLLLVQHVPAAPPAGAWRSRTAALALTLLLLLLLLLLPRHFQAASPAAAPLQELMG